MNETYCVAIRKGSEVVFFRETSQTMMEVMRLQPGVLYNVSVTLCACGSQGIPLLVLVRTGKNCKTNQRKAAYPSAFRTYMKLKFCV